MVDVLSAATPDDAARSAVALARVPARVLAGDFRAGYPPLPADSPVGPLYTMAQMYHDYAAHCRLDQVNTGREWRVAPPDASAQENRSARLLAGLIDAGSGRISSREAVDFIRAPASRSDDSASHPLIALTAVETQHHLLNAGARIAADQFAAYIRGIGGDDCAETVVVRAQADLDRGREDAVAALSSVITERVPARHPVTLLWARLLLVCAGRNIDVLHTALEYACATDSFVPFHLLRDQLLPIVDDAVDVVGDVPGVERLRAHLHTCPAPVRLSPKEFAVLRDLPTMLTAHEIAATHYISVNTVKTHIRHIYRKLDAGNRREAVNAARRLGIL